MNIKYKRQLFLNQKILSDNFIKSVKNEVSSKLNVHLQQHLSGSLNLDGFKNLFYVSMTDAIQLAYQKEFSATKKRNLKRARADLENKLEKVLNGLQISFYNYIDKLINYQNDQIIDQYVEQIALSIKELPGLTAEQGKDLSDYFIVDILPVFKNMITEYYQKQKNSKISYKLKNLIIRKYSSISFSSRGETKKNKLITALIIAFFIFLMAYISNKKEVDNIIASLSDKQKTEEINDKKDDEIKKNEEKKVEKNKQKGKKKTSGKRKINKRKKKQSQVKKNNLKKTNRFKGKSKLKDPTKLKVKKGKNSGEKKKP